MSKLVFFSEASHVLKGFALAIGALAIALSLPMAATAQDPDTMRVEEDWELVLAEPASIKTAPQLETIMSVGGSLEGVFARTTWNYREFPDFVPGGMQLQAWYGSSFLVKTNFGSDDLSTVSETVTWTQAIETDGSTLTLQVLNGESITWGSFGGTTLTLQGTANVPDLNSYDTAVSVNNSGVTFGANRVTVLRIKEVRHYDSTGNLLSTDSSPKVVFGGN